LLGLAGCAHHYAPDLGVDAGSFNRVKAECMLYLENNSDLVMAPASEADLCMQAHGWHRSN
jgi:hypothetical protein